MYENIPKEASKNHQKDKKTIVYNLKNNPKQKTNLFHNPKLG